MRTIPTVLLAVLLVVGAVAAVPGTTVAQESDDDSSVSPGQQLAGVVAVGEAELEGDVEERAYGIRVAQAASDDAKAEVVNRTLANVSERMNEIEERKDELEAARANGSMSEGEYRARMASVHAQTRSAERLANESNDTAAGLPEDVLRANGVNVTAIRTLQDRASELSGPEVAAIARSIAGNGVGAPMGQRPDGVPGGPPADAGPDRTNPGNQSAGSGANVDTSNTTDGENATTNAASQ